MKAGPVRLTEADSVGLTEADSVGLIEAGPLDRMVENTGRDTAGSRVPSS